MINLPKLYFQDDVFFVKMTGERKMDTYGIFIVKPTQVEGVGWLVIYSHAAHYHVLGFQLVIDAGYVEESLIYCYLYLFLNF